MLPVIRRAAAAAICSAALTPAASACAWPNADRDAADVPVLLWVMMTSVPRNVVSIAGAGVLLLFCYGIRSNLVLSPVSYARAHCRAQPFPPRFPPGALLGAVRRSWHLEIETKIN